MRRVSVQFIAELVSFKRGMREGADEVRKVKQEAVAAQREVAGLGEAGEKAGRQLGDGLVRGADGKLRDARGRFVKAGQESGRGFGDAMAGEASVSLVQRFGPLVAKMPLGPAGAIAGGVLGAAMAPTLAAAVAGSVVGGAGVGGVIGGAVIASRDPRVKAAGSDLGKFIMEDLETRAAGFVPVMITGIGKIKAGWGALGTDLDRIFASSRFVDPLVDGAVRGGKKLIHGISIAVENADPVVDAFGRSFDAIGDSAGNFFETLSGDAKEGASAIDDMTNSVVNLMDTVTLITHYGAQIKGGADAFDVWIDKQRYAIEDSDLFQGVLGGLLGGIDLTADGFKKGSVQAEAYRDATLGTAEVADFAVLKMAGMTDAQIAGADASGTYRQKIDEVNSAAGITQSRFYEGNAAMVIFNASMTEGIESAGGLSNAFNVLNGAALSSREAESNYQAAIDAVSESIKKNGTTLDLHTEKGRANDKAIRNLIGTVNANAQAAYDAKAATGDLAGAETDAKKVYEDGRQQLIKNLTQILGNKDAAIALAGKIMAIPKSWSTDVDVKDKATPKVAAIKHEISTINGRTVVIAVKYETHGRAPGEHIIGQGTQLKDRWGGVHEGGYMKAATGLVREAAMFGPRSPGRYLIAEPETQGEAFIPKRGDRQRSISIGRRAMEWYGMAVVPRSVISGQPYAPQAAGAGSGQTVEGDTVVYVTIDGQQLEGRIERVVRDRDRSLRRRVGAGAGRV